MSRHRHKFTLGDMQKKRKGDEPGVDPCCGLPYVPAPAAGITRAVGFLAKDHLVRRRFV
jgi:hypothetical protein